MCAHPTHPHSSLTHKRIVALFAPFCFSSKARKDYYYYYTAMIDLVEVCFKNNEVKSTSTLSKNQNIAAFREDEDDGVMKMDRGSLRCSRYMKRKYLWIGFALFVFIIVLISTTMSSVGSAPVTGGAEPTPTSNDNDPVDVSSDNDENFFHEKDVSAWNILAEFCGPQQFNEYMGFASQVSISYDGQRIAASLPGSEDGSRPYGSEIYQHDTVGLSWQQVAMIKTPIEQQSGVKVSGQNTNFMSFSKDGRHVILTSRDDVFPYIRGSGPIDAANGGFELIGQPLEHPEESSPGSHKIHFGEQHAISQTGDFLAILSRTSDGQAHIRVFHDDPNAVREDPSHKWNTVKDDIDLGDVKAVHLDISGNGETLVAGIPDATNLDGMEYAGVVQAYAFDPNTNAYQPKGDPIYGTSMGELLGGVVGISDDGKTLAVAPQGGGFVEIHSWSLAEQQWIKKGDRLMGSESQHQDEGFGLSFVLDVDGTFIAIGSPGVTDKRAFHHGQVVLYRYDASVQRWLFNGLAQSGHRGDGFGLSVDISTEGNRLVVGAPQRNVNGVDNVGCFRVYRVQQLTYGR